VKKAKEKLLDIKDVLSNLDCNNYEYYNNLSDDEKKEISSFVLMRFLSSSSGNYPEHYLLCVNDIVNYNFSILNKHPNLMWMSLALCGIGSKQYHPWYPYSYNLNSLCFATKTGI
jgi:hypothetical protein